MNSHGSSADVFGNGFYLSDYFNSASMSGERDASESTTFKRKSKTYIPGLKDSTMSFEGLFDGDIDQIDQILYTALTMNQSGLISYLPFGNEVVGNIAFSMDTVDNAYEITTDVGDVAQVSASFNAGDKGSLLRGRVAQPFGVYAAANTSIATDAGPLVVSTPNGGSLVLHTVVASSLVMKVQDSANGTTWADLTGTIPISSGRASLRLLIPGAVRRYTRVSWTGSGTFIAIFERN